MIGATDNVTIAEQKSEDLATAKARFLLNYLSRCCDPSLEWFEQHVPVLLKIAVPQPRPAHPRPRRLTGQPQAQQEPEPDSESLPWGLLRELAEAGV